MGSYNWRLLAGRTVWINALLRLDEGKREFDQPGNKLDTPLIDQKSFQWEESVEWEPTGFWMYEVRKVTEIISSRIYINVLLCHSNKWKIIDHQINIILI